MYEEYDYYREQDYDDRLQQEKENLADQNLRASNWLEAFSKQKFLIKKELRACPEPRLYDEMTWFTNWLEEIEEIEKIWREEEKRASEERKNLEQKIRLRITKRIQDETVDSPPLKVFFSSLRADEPNFWLDW